MSLSSAIKNLFTNSFILYLYIVLRNTGTLSKVDLIPNKLPINPLAYCSLKNLDVLLPENSSLIKPLFFHVLPLETLDFYYLFLLYASNNGIILFYN